MLGICVCRKPEGIMRKVAVAIAAVAGLTVGGAALPAAASTHTGYASDRTADTSLTAKVVVSDLTSTQGGRRGQVDVYYSSSGGSLELSSNYVGIESRSGYYYDSVTLSYVSSHHQRGSFLVTGTDPVGTYYVNLYAGGIISNGDEIYDFLDVDRDHVTYFAVKRNTGTSANVTPEPVKRNHYTNATGHVSKLVPYDYGLHSHYVSATYGRVHIYFNPTGSAPKHYVTSAAVNSHGNFTKSVKVTRSGTWSATYFPGGATYATSSSNGDYVTAR
jgi:hypothetical protein